MKKKTKIEPQGLVARLNSGGWFSDKEATFVRHLLTADEAEMFWPAFLKAYPCPDADYVLATMIFAFFEMNDFKIKAPSKVLQEQLHLMTTLTEAKARLEASNPLLPGDGQEPLLVHLSTALQRLRGTIRRLEKLANEDGIRRVGKKSYIRLFVQFIKEHFGKLGLGTISRLTRIVFTDPRIAKNVDVAPDEILGIDKSFVQACLKTHRQYK